MSLLTGGAGNENYWHWFFDVLPRLWIAEKKINLKNINYFLFPNLKRKFQIETIKILKIPFNNCLSSKKYKHILFGVSASGPTKIWGIENYIKLAKEISKKIECKFYIAAGPNDINLIKKFKESDVGKDCVSFEKLSIKETLPIIKNCDCYIGNDTGFGHISVALKIKSLFIFMDTPIRVYGSYAPSLISTVEPEGENQSTVHNTLGKKSISFKEVLEKTLNLII